LPAAADQENLHPLSFIDRKPLNRKIFQKAAPRVFFRNEGGLHGPVNDVQTLSRIERYLSAEIPMTFKLFFFMETGTSLKFGMTTGRFAPG